MLFNKLTVTALLCVCTIAAISQTKTSKIKFGDIKPEDFKPEYYTIDSSADAIYLYDYGSSKHMGNNTGSFNTIRKIHERIRLMHNKSFKDLATVKIVLEKFNDGQEKIDDLQASTYTIENGAVVTTKVDKNSIFKDKDGDDQIVKFTFPNLQEGCIIEYAYTETIPAYSYIPSWTFQGEYPELWSQFDLEVPQFFEFVLMRQGFLDAAVDTASISADNFNILQPGGVNASNTISIRSNTIRHTWIYKDVPAIKEEKFTTNISNYVQKIQFQFSAIRFPNEDPKYYMHTWPETVEQLMKDEDFGAELSKGNGWLKDDIKEATDNETDIKIKAKKIYEYVRDNYNCIDYSAIYLSQPLKKTEQTKKGNVVDINMLLVAMLRNAGYEADPVLLSTRGHGKTYDMYPILNKFNYLIAQVLIDNKPYLLDASEPLLGFGHLSEDCYNGKARLIALNPVLIDLSADSLHQSEITSLFLANDAEGKVAGTYKHVMNEMQSADMRSKMKKTNKDEYFKEVKKSFSFDVNLDNKTIDSLKQPEMPVAVQYDFSFKPEDDIVYFTPVISDGAYKQNPFAAAQRYYPVEMPYCSDETYILNMEIPAGYTVDELPKPARVSLNDNEGSFEYLIQKSSDHMQLRCRTKLNKATFEPDDYETLRNFFAFIVEKEGEQIVFKKQ